MRGDEQAAVLAPNLGPSKLALMEVPICCGLALPAVVIRPRFPGQQDSLSHRAAATIF